MNHLTIIQAAVGDVEQLRTLAAQTFYETFAAHNTEANMTKYLAENLSAGKLTSELTHPDSAFYFAVLEERLAGYLKLNFGPAQTENGDQDAVEIERIYVLGDFQGKKIGQALLDTAITLARGKNAHYLWLGVWEKNLNAIRFYEKQGFVEFGRHAFVLGEDVQTDLLMRVDLRAGLWRPIASQVYPDSDSRKSR